MRRFVQPRSDFCIKPKTLAGSHVPHVLSLVVLGGVVGGRGGSERRPPARSESTRVWVAGRCCCLAVVEENIRAFESPPTLMTHFALSPALFTPIRVTGSCLIALTASAFFTRRGETPNDLLHKAGMLRICQALLCNF